MIYYFTDGTTLVFQCKVIRATWTLDWKQIIDVRTRTNSEPTILQEKWVFVIYLVIYC